VNRARGNRFVFKLIVLGSLMKRFRASPAASPVTPTAGTGMPRDPGSRDAA
jgi:hypothetical protein